MSSQFEPRRHKKSGSKRSPRHSPSSTPEVSEVSYEGNKEDAWESEEQTPEPQVCGTIFFLYGI